MRLWMCNIPYWLLKIIFPITCLHVLFLSANPGYPHREEQLCRHSVCNCQGHCLHLYEFGHQQSLFPYFRCPWWQDCKCAPIEVSSSVVQRSTLEKSDSRRPCQHRLFRAEGHSKNDISKVFQKFDLPLPLAALRWDPCIILPYYNVTVINTHSYNEPCPRLGKRLRNSLNNVPLKRE